MTLHPIKRLFRLAGLLSALIVTASCGSQRDPNIGR
jgi:hypothetical protein